MNGLRSLFSSAFLGFVVGCALDTREDFDGEIPYQPLRGLPESLEAWDRKLDTYRRLAANLEEAGRISHNERTLLQRGKRMLAVGPVHAGDLDKIRLIRVDFFLAPPQVRAICERALFEDLHEKDAIVYLLSGIAAADGLLGLAQLLNSGTDGRFRCSHCNCLYEYTLFGDRVAIYAASDLPIAAAQALARDDRALLDFKERAPSRADGFLVPVGETDVLDHRAAALLSLAEKAPGANAIQVLRHLLGTFACSTCGTQSSPRAI